MFRSLRVGVLRRLPQLTVIQSTHSGSSVTLGDLVNSWPGKYRLSINGFMREVGDGDYLLRAKQQNIDPRLWMQYSLSFRRKLMKDPLMLFGSVQEFQAFRQALDHHLDTDNADSTETKELLFSKILQQALVELGDQISSYQTLLASSDLRHPQNWYPLARILKRKIIYHGGPTNSGKVCVDAFYLLSLFC